MPPKQKKYSWIDDDRIPSQAEIDFYVGQGTGEVTEITQAHLDEIGQGAGGEGLTVDDVGTGGTILTTDPRDINGDGTVDPKEREDAWALNPKNPNSVNHPDYVAPEENPDWSDPSLGGGGHDNAPGATVVPPSGTDDDSDTPTHEPSQAEIDYYASLDAGQIPKITQTHLNEIGLGEGGEGLTESDVGPANQPLSSPLIQSSKSSSAAGGYGKKRGREISRKHMNLTGSSRRSLLTGV